jgi:hypothetical protein
MIRNKALYEILTEINDHFFDVSTKSDFHELKIRMTRLDTNEQIRNAILERKIEMIERDITLISGILQEISKKLD